MLGLSPGILKWVKLIDNFEGEYDYVTNEGPVFTFKTNRHSPNYRLINIDFTDPEESKWKVLVPEHKKDVLGKALRRKAVLLCLVSTSVNWRSSFSGDRSPGREPSTSNPWAWCQQCSQVFTVRHPCSYYAVMQDLHHNCGGMNPDVQRRHFFKNQLPLQLLSDDNNHLHLIF